MSDPATLLDLDATSALESVVREQRVAARAEANRLAAVVAFCDCHPVVDERDIAAAWPVEISLDGEPVGPPLNGEGCPQVTEDAVHELCAALGISHHTALRLVGQTLELRFRLPRLWRLVHELTLPAWQALKAAEQTIPLSPEAAAFVDRHLAVAGKRGRLTGQTISATVGLAEARFDPERARTREQDALAARGVWFDISPDTPATTDVYARLDTLDAQALDETVSDLATTLGRLGDQSPLDTRRATALGMLADPQHVLDLDMPAPARPVTTPILYLHVDADDLETGTAGSIEKLGPATLALIATWLERVGKVRIQPVLDMSTSGAVDRHDPPEWMHTLVVLRDRHCVFRGCRTAARSCDLDHITPYEEHGPPGQTSPKNLAPLCRRHHNQKTHHGWRYQRTDDGYEWRSPLGREHLVPHLN
ncbi:MAG: hypothetical protein HOQ22_06220 [Nocardioidaceae bacterium]|nr:hypothetical protein [Nocardioidaceae bacterium]NUS50625.1 hypothetical protein [Nocardioidaceae bacterium]